MSPFVAQRQIALAAVALLAIVVALAVTELPFGGEGAASEAERRSVAAPGTGWYRALAAPYRFPEDAEQTACGLPTTDETLGVAHPVLPCGARIVIEHEGNYVLTQVVDRGSGAPGREFDVVAPLAEALELQGVQEIRWRYARPDE
ncbi:MAG TPA: hypothetical protein VM290_02095 [Gaiellaceae bacterium]|nr:hypothetical protein [Gaiellaceae bacterium]